MAIIVLVMSPFLFITAHLDPLATARGISASQAAWGVMLLAVFTAVGQISLGGAAERIGWMRGAAMAAFISMAAILWLIPAGNTTMIYTFAIVYGIFLGGAIVLLMGVTSVFFGTRSLAEILGYFIGAEVLVGALFSFFGGVIFDRTGTYLTPLVITAAALVIAGVYSLVIKPPKPKEG
jgi:MFS family permease